MSDIYKTEYTELRNAPHFIFNGQHTRDFHVQNVQIDSGLAKDTFLPDRNLTIERTRYSDKSYLLGYKEEPLKFKIRLLFDEHEFKHHHIAALRRWLHTETFEEFKFDNEEESALNIVVYAMVTNSSELTHNVINDGYLDLEFTTNSSRKYSEVMEDEYDFTKSASEKILEEFDVETKVSSKILENCARGLKRYTARTNYTNIEEFFLDENQDNIPDGWKIVEGDVNGISISENGLFSFQNIRLRKRINMINGRNYYIRMHGIGGKFRIHEKDFDITDNFVHQFKYRRNLLGHKGTFDLDSSADGIGEGWTKVGNNGSFSIDRINEVQTIRENGVLSAPVTIVKGQKYILVAEDINRNSTISINSRSFKNTTGKLNKFKFIGQEDDKSVSISSATTSATTELSYIRIYTVTDEEFEEFDSLSEESVREKYPYFDAHSYFELNYSNTAGTIAYIDMWELNDLNKKKLDSGTPIEDIVYFNYQEFTDFIDDCLTKYNVSKANLLDNFEKLNSIKGIEFDYLKSTIESILQGASQVIPEVKRGDNMKYYQWDDLQPFYRKIMEYSDAIVDVMKYVYDFTTLNKSAIDESTEIGNNKITVYNFGDKPIYPTFYFESRDGTSIMIQNHDTNQKTIISDNIGGEKIEMIGATEQIYTSRPSPYYKYNAHDDVFIKLREGFNDLEFSGNFKMKIVYQFIIL